jgi:glycine/D-amino acid oxidase-like deaminating enzyme
MHTEAAMPSIWNPAGRRSRPSLHDDLTVDVAVVGGGIVGVTAALLLAREGRSVALLEARHIGAGTTGRSTAKVSALQGERYRGIRRMHGPAAAATYAEAQTSALAWMEEQVRLRSIDCDWEQRTAVTYATSEEGARRLADEADAATEAGLPVRPGADHGLPFATTAAIALEGQAQFSPVAYLDGLVDELDALPSASVFEGTRVTAIRGRGPHRVVTADATIRAEHVVVATLLPITDRSLMFARAEPKASHTIAVRIEGALPPHHYLSVDEPTRSLRTVRHRDGDLLLVGGEGSAIAHGARPSEAAGRLETWAREHFRVVQVVDAWSAHDLVPVDHLPWVGPTSPVTPRVLTASGFEKWGLTMGTAAARLLADHIVDEERTASSPAWQLFHPTRVAPRSLPSLARLNAGVAGRLVVDWVRPDDAPDGQGDGRRYRAGLVPAGDPDGSSDTTPVRVVCTHLGGVCRWNDLDRTWDCPLHGSRFEEDGTVVSGPAVRPLDRG